MMDKTIFRMNRGFNFVMYFNEMKQMMKSLTLIVFITGIKVIGGVKEATGEEFGVYVKRILPGGIASSDGRYF